MNNLQIIKDGLKPCPLCGTSPDLYQIEAKAGIGTYYYLITCHKCSLQMKDNAILKSYHRETLFKEDTERLSGLSKKWNTRI